MGRWLSAGDVGSSFTFLFRLLMWSFTVGKCALSLPTGSIIVVRYGASCKSNPSELEEVFLVEKGKGLACQFSGDAVVEFFDCAFVGICGECAFGCPIRSGVEDFDCVCYPCLSGCHPCKRVRTALRYWVVLRVVAVDVPRIPSRYAFVCFCRAPHSFSKLVWSVYEDDLVGAAMRLRRTP